MAAVSRIQVANFLTDGFVPGMEWAPLYRGETFRLFGQPTAMQIDNGGGKSSLTEACLYMLTRDRRLKQRVEGRVAPVDKGWTHVRIEFFEKPHDWNILQADLITLDPKEMPGTSYVVGMCWSRTKNPYFYSYQGSLDDAPCYTQGSGGLTLIANDIFQKSVERLPGAKWNRWSSQKAWLEEEIKQFTNIEVLRQNVEFQMEGAGDYSAMITKVKPEANEAYDTAFFRQFIAPELLKYAMGTEGDPDEEKFEDTILKTLKPAADALLDISRRQQELDHTKEALQKFGPVLEKANDVVTANTEYENEMLTLAQKAATVQSLVGNSPLPGIPAIPFGTQWASDKHAMSALGYMLIDKKHGTVITDEGLASLMGIEVERVNQYAEDKNMAGVMTDLQLIDLKDVFKRTQDNVVSGADDTMDVQLIENKDVLKKTKRGERRHLVIYYDLKSALLLVSAPANLASVKIPNLSDVLKRAFGIASDEIDTNPYRRHLRKLKSNLGRVKQQKKEAEKRQKQHNDEYEKLLDQDRYAKENKIAYENFTSRKGDFPEEHWASPIAACKWAQAEEKRLGNDRTEHVQLTSERKSGYDKWKDLVSKHGLISLPEALSALNCQYREAKKADETARQSLTETRRTLSGKRTDLDKEREKANKAKKNLDKLQGFAEHMPTFRDIFKDADPMRLNPQADARTEQDVKLENDRLLQDANKQEQLFLDLQPKTQIFTEIFGEIAPERLNPSRDLQEHLKAIGVEENIIKEHQSLLKALTLFRERYPDFNPNEWLSQMSEHRRKLTEERAGNQRAINDLDGELEDLSAFGAADDRVYARALKLLSGHGIAFERMHDLAAQTVRDTRLEQCLTLFSAFLSAPVIDSIEMATEAAKLLETARLTVPIFFKPTLEAFLQKGNIQQAGEVAYDLWIGRRTRQVAILINPLLVIEEKKRIGAEIKTLTQRNEEIKTQLEGISEEGDVVKTALDAREAIRRGSEQIYAKAAGNLENLQAKTFSFERRASTEAQEAISAMKRYLQMGGESGYQELIETTIPKLKREQTQIAERLDILASQTTEQALRALLATKDFHSAGGEKALAAAKTEFDLLSSAVETLDGIIEKLQAELDGPLTKAAGDAEEALRLINKTYALENRDLEAAISFQENGFVSFMEEASAHKKKLDDALEVAQKRLRGIDFDRANRYLQSSKTEERSLVERIAEEKGKRDAAQEDVSKADNEIVQIGGEVASMEPYMEAMHSMVAAIRTQYAKVALFSEDIRRRALASSVADPEIQSYAETIRSACTGEIPGTDSGIYSAMRNLEQCINELKIDTANLQRLAKHKLGLTNEFIQRRDDFCARARAGEIRGLNQLEISTIAEAKTIEELRRIQGTRDSIQRQIDEISDNLGRIRKTMETNKEASIESLVKLARQANMSLTIMERVMKRTPGARFHIKAPVADEKEIEQIINNLLEQIEDREHAIHERGIALLNDDIERAAADYKQLIHNTIYRRIFFGRDENGNPVVPKVYFTHASIRGSDMVPYSNSAGLSTGQQTALAMMWLIKQTEFAIARAATLYGNKKEQKAALQGAQRIMFFDGLFSNLSKEDYINDAFQGLRGVGENFQLIGLIHNPYYVNNKDIFPVHLIGRRKVAIGDEAGSRHTFVSIEPYNDNSIILFTSAYKHHAHGNAPEAGDD